ncbi:hypothetical protein ACSSS7_001614 [Eimeria intestinalis]
MFPSQSEDHYSSGSSLSSSSSRGSEDALKKPNVPSDPSRGEWHASSTVGVIFCINPKAPDSQLLVKALAEVCSAPLAVLLQLHWLRRDSCKRRLQLELHRTVFQETTLPIRMMQRFLALLHVAVGAEAAAFFIIDAQNLTYICLGGHRKATGLRLSRNHRLLGEATRHGGQTVLLNYLLPGINKEYDERADFETRHVLLVPLLSTQGQVKAVVLLLNKQSCRCMRLLESKVRADDPCVCRQQIRAFTEASLAFDVWNPSAPPCYKCCRAHEGELSYEDYITTPSWSLELGSASHFIRQGYLGDGVDFLAAWHAMYPMIFATEGFSVCEMQHFLGSQLTNLCMTGMSLLEPMQTMVSYVMADQLRGGKGGTKPTGAVMTRIENLVLLNKRLKLLSLRRCESVAATDPESPVSGSDAGSGRKGFGPSSSRRESSMQQSAPSASSGTAGLRGPSRPVLSLFKSLKKYGWPERKERMKRADPEAQHSASRISLPVTIEADLNVWDRRAEDLELFFFLALEDLGIMVKSEQAKLQAYFRLIRDAYHTDNPYHNFYHAIHVTQMCWLFLTRYACKESLSLTEQLGLLLAALAHDVDHPGVNNRSLCEEQHPLAITYNDKAVLENHHAAFAARTMVHLGLFSRSPGFREARAPAGMPVARGRSAQNLTNSPGLRPEAARNNRSPESSDDELFYPEFAKIRRILVNCILATDMELFSHHHEAMRTRAQVNRTTGEIFRSDEDRTLLMNCLIHCADISNPLLPDRRNVQWASLIVQEFNAQAEAERTLA